MKGFFFWIFATLLLAVVVHIGTVLMVPRLEGGGRVTNAMRGGDLNRLTVLATSERAYKVLRVSNSDLVYAVCPFDITQRPMIVSARVPDRYWSMSIYGEDGSSLYTLNDIQVGVQSFSAELRLQGQDGFAQTDTGQRDNERLVVRSSSERGIIIFRAFASDASEHERAAEQLAQTTCSTNKSSTQLNQDADS